MALRQTDHRLALHVAANGVPVIRYVPVAGRLVRVRYDDSADGYQELQAALTKLPAKGGARLGSFTPRQRDRRSREASVSGAAGIGGLK